MAQIRGDGSARSQQTRLGRALHDARDRVFGELQVVVGAEDRKKRTLYGLRRVSAESAMNGAEDESTDADARSDNAPLLEELQ